MEDVSSSLTARPLLDDGIAIEVMFDVSPFSGITPNYIINDVCSLPPHVM